MIQLLLAFALFYNVVTWSESAKILMIISTPSYSHQVVFQPLWKELSLRGHQVTALTANPLKDPTLVNLTEIDLSSSYEVMERHMKETINSQDDLIKMIKLATASFIEVTDNEFSNSEVQKLITNKSEHFDIVIAEMTSVFYLFSERFNSPFIGVFSGDAPYGFYELMGNPIHPALNPDDVLAFDGKLTFIQRLVSVLYGLFQKNLITQEHTGYVEAAAKKYFGKSYPPLRKIREASMMFLNSDHICCSIIPLIQPIIQIGGGMHLHSPKPLPKDLEKYLNSATEGFIYFTLGSSIKGEYVAEKTRDIILKTFAELPYKVLWKFELEDWPGKPGNVLVSKWFPQQDIFKHPNIKLFITHGGFQSVEEAIYNHVPMLGIPFSLDQPYNIKRMVHNGLGLSLDHRTLDKESFKKTILEIINNSKYRSRIMEIANLGSDGPMTGLEKAVWLTEFVIRHKGAKHLRSPMLDVPTYQYLLLDVTGFIVLIISITIFVNVKIIGYTLRKLKVKSEVGITTF